MQAPLAALSLGRRSSRSPLETVKLSRIIPLPTATAIKLELNTRLQLADFTRVQQGGIEKEKREKGEKREVQEASNFEKQRTPTKEERLTTDALDT